VYLSYVHSMFRYGRYLDTLTYSMALVRKRTIPTERPQLIGEVSDDLCEQRVPRGQRDRSP
jgi:hypothetical protein